MDLPRVMQIDFHKDLKTFSHKIPIVVKYVLHENPVRWMENWLNRQAAQWNEV